MKANFQSLKREISSYEVDEVTKTGDSFAQFPYVTIIGKGLAAVYVHEGIEEEIRSRFEIMSEAVVDRLFVATSVASGVMRKRVETMSKKRIASFYSLMCSPDGVSRSIYEAIENAEIEEKKGGMLLDAARRGDFINDISKVNAIRLAMKLTDTPLDTLENVRHAGLHNIETTFNPERLKYTRTLELFGTGGPIRGTRVFMGSMPEVLLAAAFPMSEPESEAATELLK